MHFLFVHLTKDYNHAQGLQQTIAFLGVRATKGVEDDVHTCRDRNKRAKLCKFLDNRT